MAKPMILIVDADKKRGQQLLDKLTDNYEVILNKSGREALMTLDLQHLKIRVVLISAELPDIQPKDLLIKMKEISYLPELIIMSEQEDLNLAISTLKEGAFDFILNPLEKKNLAQIVETALENTESVKKIENYAKQNLLDQFDMDRRLALAQDLMIRRREEDKPITAEEILTLFPLPEERINVSLDQIKIEIDQKIDQHPFLKQQATVLVIEDETMYRQMLCGFLKAEYTILEAENGETVLEIIKNTQNIDVVLLDILLPDISGIDLLPKIKAAIPDVEIVVLTAFELIDVAIQTLKDGAYDFINKPILKNQLLNTVSQAAYRKYLRKILPEVSKQLMEEKLSQKSKISLLKDLMVSRKNTGKKLLMEDIYSFFPELRTACIPEGTVIPETLIETGLDVFIDDLKDKIHHFNPGLS
ncbi:response regulator [Thermoproteota archaeon]